MGWSEDRREIITGPVDLIRGTREGLIGVPQEGAGVGKIAERERNTLGCTGITERIR